LKEGIPGGVVIATNKVNGGGFAGVFEFGYTKAEELLKRVPIVKVVRKGGIVEVRADVMVDRAE
jgi:hypothetical protein